MKISEERENALLKAVNANFRTDWMPYIFGYEQIGDFVLFAVSEKVTDYYYDDEDKEQKKEYYTASLYEIFTPDVEPPALIDDDDPEYIASADDPSVCNEEVCNRLNLRALMRYREYNRRGLLEFGK